MSEDAKQSRSLAGEVEAQSITYPISPEYVKNWTPVMGLREVIANALDEDKHPRIAWADGVLTVEDDGPGIPEEGLILGISRKTDDQLGVWGEGLNIGMLVLARARSIGKVEIESVGYTLRPKLTKAPLLRTRNDSEIRPDHQLLTCEIEPNDRTRGTKVTIVCKRELAEQAISFFLHLHDPEYTAPETPGRVLTDIPGGRIYVGGLLVQEKKGLCFSYDIAISDSKRRGIQNRDRTTIDSHHLEYLVKQILYTVDDPEILLPIVKAALAGKLTKLERAFYSGRADAGYRRAFKQVGEQLFGDTKVCFKEMQTAYRQRGWADWEAEFETEDEMLLDLVDKGYRVLEPKIDYHEFRALMQLLGVRSAGELYKKPHLRKRDEKTLWIKPDDLTPEQRRNYEDAIVTVRGMWGSQAIDQVQPYRYTREENGNALGLYLPRNGKIGIQVDALNTFKDALEVLAHEAAHRLRHRESHDYGDRTRGFESQLVRMAASAAIVARDAGLLPATMDELREREDARPKHPSEVVAAFLQERMQQKGIKSASALAEQAGISAAAARSVVTGRNSYHGFAVPSRENVQAVCHVLDADWLPVFLSGSIVNAMFSHTRRHSDNRLYGRSYVAACQAIAELRARGGRSAELADVVEEHANGTVPTKHDDPSWLAPYAELIAAEIARSRASD